MKPWLRDWGPALLWAAAIFVASSRSSVPLPMPNNLDKVAHAGAYTILGAALAWGAARTRMMPLLAVSIGMFYGVTDEVHQLFVPGRHFDLMDWLADSVGVTLGVALFYPLFIRLAAARRSRIS